ncbi:MAG: hypothetical protein IJF74_01825, partial [Clostridia bacterium]|nr:hypothetical protein [Clostridia bacterium]
MKLEKMTHLEAAVQDLIDTGWSKDVCICIGNSEEEIYRHFNSNRGNVLTGKTYYDMMSVSKILAVSPIFHIAMEEGKVSPEDTLG